MRSCGKQGGHSLQEAGLLVGASGRHKIRKSEIFAISVSEVESLCSVFVSCATCVRSCAHTLGATLCNGSVSSCGNLNGAFGNPSPYLHTLWILRSEAPTLSSAESACRACGLEALVAPLLTTRIRSHSCGRRAGARVGKLLRGCCLQKRRWGCATSGESPKRHRKGDARGVHAPPSVGPW